MKFRSLFLLSFLIMTHDNSSMEPSPTSLSHDMLIKIMACSDLETQRTLRITYKLFAAIEVKDLLDQSPLIMSRKDHIHHLIQLAKTHSSEINKALVIKNLIYNADLCDHEDVLDLLLIINPNLYEPSLFPFPVTANTAIKAMSEGDRAALETKEKIFTQLTEVTRQIRNLLFSKLDTLFEQVVALYSGDKTLMDQYIPLLIACDDTIEINKLTPLIAAALCNNITFTELLLAQSHDLINQGNRLGATPLFLTESPKICSMLLSCNGIQPNKRPHTGPLRGVTPLHKAIWYQNKILQNIFLAHPGFIINEEDENQLTPLHEAARRNQIDIFNFFFKHAHNNHAQSDTTPLHIAAQTGSCSITNFILENDPTQIDLQTEDGETALFLASEYGNFATVSLLIAKKASINIANKELKTPLWQATNKGYFDIVKFLLDYGADVNAEDKDKATPLITAICNGCPEIAELLITHGADINRETKDYRNALDFALNTDDQEIISLLLDHPDLIIQKKYPDGSTRLHSAAKDGNVKAFTFWLKKIGDIMYNPTQPIHTATAYNQTEIIQIILDRDRTQINIKDNHSCTALHIASSYGHINTVKLLLEHGAIIDVTDSFGTTPLIVASAQGYAEIVQLLLDHGADPHKKDKYGESAVSMAEHDEVIACFKKER